MFKPMLGVCVVLCILSGVLPVRADDAQQLAETAKKTLQTYDKAIITLTAVIKIEIKGVGTDYSGQSHEQKTQCLATIIDPSGLAVAPLSYLAPTIRRSMGGQTIEVECQVQEVKYRLTDGTEVPARLVLKDDDLDLAFLAPLKPFDKATAAKISFVPLSEPATQPEVLDSTILISRTGEELNYIPTLNLGRILSLVSTPRTCYLTSGGSLGVPVFNRQGKLMGMICRCVKAEGSDAGGARGSTLVSPLSQLILPVADVMKLVPQVKEEAKKAAETEKKPGAAKKKHPGSEKKSAKPEKKPAGAEKKPAAGTTK
jgi:hypothetical protein